VWGPSGGRETRSDVWERYNDKTDCPARPFLRRTIKTAKSHSKGTLKVDSEEHKTTQSRPPKEKHSRLEKQHVGGNIFAYPPALKRDFGGERQLLKGILLGG